MEIRPILSALMRNKIGLVLIALQVALTLAIVTNSLFIIAGRFELMGRPSGVDEPNVFTIASLRFAPGFDTAGSMTQDLAMLRGMAGVVDATVINSLPVSNGGWNTGVSSKQFNSATSGPDETKNSAMYMVDDHGLNALGLELAEGRNFRPDEITDRPDNSNAWPAVMIVTKALADKLWPGESAVGKTMYLGDEQSVTVVGVLKRLQAPWVGNDDVEQSSLVPQRGLWSDTRYVVRTKAGDRDRLMKEVEQKLEQLNSGRIVRSLRSFEEIRNDSYARDHAMTVILISVIVGLFIITGLGIIGMASFWVTQRTKQIGTRRALGARRFDILRYFQVENFLITSMGLALGVVLAYGFNLWLMRAFDASRMSWYYVPIGVVGIWLLGQLAVIGPATRAARVSPSVATRSV
jgi:putative ABC transport system permease protein